jgi:Rps23 Pro-64 3,4-dihydroxylase Tpa1-like proline 4-hydroxylase
LVTKLLGPQLIQILGPQIRLLQIELAANGDGCFYDAHRDATRTVASKRAVSLVYFAFGEEVDFKGGDLILFDSSVGDTFTRNAFTRVRPINDRLVLFPSWCVHQVERIYSPGGSLARGRLSVTGWLAWVTQIQDQHGAFDD